MRVARAFAAAVWVLGVASGPLAGADESPPPAAPGAPQPVQSASRGVAVLARPGAETAAWELAKAVYAEPSLRPAGLDEVRARVLVGEPLAADAPRATRDLAEERAAVHGDDGASRALLATIASQLGVTALLVVEPSTSGPPGARLFLVDAQTFDAARYLPDAEPLPTVADAGATTSSVPEASDGGAMDASTEGGVVGTAPAATPALRWTGTVTSVERVMAAPTILRAPALATSPAPVEKPKEPTSHPFYSSPWFWGAVGAAVFGGTAVWFATRDNSPSTIHLDLEVPK